VIPRRARRIGPVFHIPSPIAPADHPRRAPQLAFSLAAL